MADESVVEQTQDDVSSTTDTTKTSETKTTDPTKTQTTSAQKPATGQNSSEEDRRFKGIQADLAKERKARQQYERDLAAARAEVEAERRRVAALAGVNVPSPEEAEAAEIRARFGKVYPREELLKYIGLSQEDIDDLKASKSERETLKATQDHIWNRQATRMVDSVVKELAAEYGKDLSKRQKDQIALAYVVRAQNDPEFLQRHEDEDPTLVSEFAKEWLEDWFEPARRKITASEVNRFGRVPSGKDRGLVTTGEKKIDVKDNKAVEDLLVAGFRERGGQFKR